MTLQEFPEYSIFLSVFETQGGMTMFECFFIDWALHSCVSFSSEDTDPFQLWEADFCCFFGHFLFSLHLCLEFTLFPGCISAPVFTSLMPATVPLQMSPGSLSPQTKLTPENLNPFLYITLTQDQEYLTFFLKMRPRRDLLKEADLIYRFLLQLIFYLLLFLLTAYALLNNFCSSPLNLSIKDTQNVFIPVAP